MKLLLAEDEVELSNALRALLEHSGYVVDAVYDGQSALDLGRINYYDGFIFDIMMPVMDGLTALCRLRSLGIVTPALLLTAKSEVEDRVAGLDAGADDYLAKPFAMKELLARINAMIRRKETLAVDQWQIGNLQLRRSTMELSNGSSSIRLNVTEYQMIEMFFQNPGKAITSDQLIERVWPADGEGDADTVTIYISYLRHKMQALQARPALTEADGAYCLEVAP